MRVAVDDCRRGSHPLGYEAVKLLTEQGTPMLSPKWLADGAPLTVKKLLEVPLIPDPRWPEWFKLAGFPNPKPRFIATRFPNYELEAQAAARGSGAALLSPVLFADLTAQGALVVPFPHIVEGPNSYWLLGTTDSLDSHFARWIRSQFGS